MLEPRELKGWQQLTDAMLKHAARDDADALAQVAQLLADAQAKLPAVAAELRGIPAMGGVYEGRPHSWADLAGALGVTRSAAAQRFRYEDTRPLYADLACANGDTVKEGHLRYCRDNGHAGHSVNGAPIGTCPRCGDFVDHA